MGISTFKLAYRSEEDIENTTGILCEQYLPEVYQYINYWVDNNQLAEELTRCQQDYLSITL
jgi:hypothetical protein